MTSEITFASADFSTLARFDGSAFGDGASYKGAVFKSPAEFTGKSKEQSSRLLEVNVNGIRDASGVALVDRI